MGSDTPYASAATLLPSALLSVDAGEAVKPSNAFKPEQSDTCLSLSDKEKTSSTAPPASSFSSITRVFLLTACLTLANVLYTMISGATTIVLDELAGDLHIAENNLQWAFNSGQLPFGCFILVAGKAADICGRKRVFVLGIAFVAIWTLVAGFMKNEAAFYVCRAFGGLASSLVTGSNIGIIAEHTQPGRIRSLAIGISIAGMPLGTAVGFIVSGPLAAGTGWRSIFYLLAGLNLIPLLGVMALAKDYRPDKADKDLRVDWAGGSLFTIAAVLLFFCLSQALSESAGWRTPYILVLFVLSFVLLSAALAWIHYLERKTSFPPIMRLSIVTQNRGRVGLVYIIVFCCASSYAGFMYASTIFYHRFEDLKPLGVTLRYLPGPIVGIICNIGVGLLASRVNGIWFFLLGTFGTGLSNILFAVMNVNASYWAYQFSAQAMCLMGPDIIICAAYVYIVNVVDPAEVAVAGASLQFFVALAFVCGPSFSTLIYTSVLHTKHGATLTQGASKGNMDLLTSLRATFWFWGALCFSALLLSVAFLRSMGKTPTTHVQADPVQIVCVKHCEGPQKESESGFSGAPVDPCNVYRCKVYKVICM